MRRWRLLVAALGLAVWLTGCAVVETAGDVAIGTGQVVLGAADLLI